MSKLKNFETYLKEKSFKVSPFCDFMRNFNPHLFPSPYRLTLIYLSFHFGVEVKVKYTEKKVFYVTQRKKAL